jgi:hypothetical protein
MKKMTTITIASLMVCCKKNNDKCEYNYLMEGVGSIFRKRIIAIPKRSESLQ